MKLNVFVDIVSFLKSNECIFHFENIFIEVVIFLYKQEKFPHLPKNPGWATDSTVLNQAFLPNMYYTNKRAVGTEL